MLLASIPDILDIDLSQIIELTEEHNRTYRPVAVTEFRQDAKRLYYVNADHVSGIDNPSCETVRQAVILFRPDFIVVEGAETGAEGGSFLEFVNEEVVSGFIRGGERAYAAYLAIKNKIPFAGGEPPPGVIFSAMKEEGYSTQDMIAFYLLIAVPRWRLEGKLNQDTFLSRAAKRLDLYREKSGASDNEALGVEAFAAWFEAHNTTGKPLNEIDDEDLRPTNCQGANYFQRLHHKLDPIRERHIDTVISKSFIQYDKVLVVYGDGHLVKSRRVFERMFGDPGRTVKLASPCGRR